MPPRPPSPWLRKALAVGGVLVAANLVFAVVGPALPEPVTYPTREVQLSVELLDQQTAAGCVDLLVTGNSIAAHDVSATGLADGLGLRSGVVSVLPGSVATVDVDWMRRVTVPRADPGTLVYVVSPLTFAPEAVTEQFGLAIYSRSVAVRGGWGGELHRWAIEHSPLIRHRLALADPEALVGWAKGELPETYGEILAATGRAVDPDGHIRASGQWGGSTALLDRIRQIAGTVADEWDVDPRERDLLGGQLAALAAEGRRVVVVVPPVTDALVEVYPGGPAAYEAYLAAARSLADADGVELVDLSTAGYGDELFWDTHHLNEDGATRFTEDLADELRSRPSVRCDQR